MTHGFHEAADMLGLGEMQQTSADSSSVSDDALIDAILIEKYQDNLCDAYSNSYDMFRLWAFNSLDKFKFELIPFCFPLFVHRLLKR